MNRVEDARLIIRTGERGTTEDVTVTINGHRLVARKLAGGTDSGETMLATMFFGSVIHSLTLGHAGGAPWDVDQVEIFGLLSDGTVQHFKIRPEAPLGDGAELDIWPAPPAPPAPAPGADGFEV